MDSSVTARASEAELANSLRALAMDAVEAAKSGHPGMPMGMAEIAVALWKRHLRHNPANADWPNRDRFVLSNGHGSMLLYSLLHLTGYELPMAELRRFRQLGSKTPGHPERGCAPGVETTTGPLGQGIGNAVGMAIAERILREEYGSTVVNHRTWVFASDGDLMEGIGHEAASLAGHLRLGDQPQGVRSGRPFAGEQSCKRHARLQRRRECQPAPSWGSASRASRGASSTMTPLSRFAAGSTN